MSRHRRALRVCAVPLLTGGLLAACSVKKPYPEKALFTIDVGAPSFQAPMRKDAVLRVRRLRIAPPYDGRMFVSRTGHNRFKMDYYDGFVAAPAQILTGELLDWLSSSALFRSVVDSSSSADHQYLLEGNVTELYGDYTQPASGRAVMEVTFFLIQESGASMEILFEQEYRQTVALEGSEAEALAEGMGRAYREILVNLTRDLAELRLDDEP